MFENLPQFVSQDACLSCDGCCRFKEQNSSWRPKVAQEELDEILHQELDENGRIKAAECRGRFQCTHFCAENNTCRIYEQRPFECSLYPFLLIGEGEAVAVGVHLSCPYVQEKWQDADFKSHVEGLQRYFQQQEVLEFIQRNRSLLGDYSGCEQEVECLFDLQM